MNLAGKLKRLEALQSTAYYADRIASELLYIYRVSQYNGGKYDIEIENACDHVLACLDEEMCIRDRFGQAETLFSRAAPYPLLYCSQLLRKVRDKSIVDSTKEVCKPLRKTVYFRVPLTNCGSDNPASRTKQEFI